MPARFFPSRPFDRRIGKKTRTNSLSRTHFGAHRRAGLSFEALESRTMLSVTSTFFGTVSLDVGPVVNVTKAALNQVSPTIAVDRPDPNNVYAAANPGTSAALSTNSGSTFTTFDGATGLAGGSSGNNKSVWDDFGNLFVVYENAAGDEIDLAISTTGGGAGTFSILATIDSGNVDRPSVAVGPGSTPGTGSVWVTWNDNGTIKARGAEVTGLGGVGAFSTEQSSLLICVDWRRLAGDCNRSQRPGGRDVSKRLNRLR